MIQHTKKEGEPTYAVGHLALGYLSGKATSKLLNVNVNIPLLFVTSVISDVDLLIPGLEHRGPAHSLIIFLLLFLPAFILYGKRAVPYVIAVTQHSIPGDYLTGEGIQLLWPITTKWYGTGISMISPTIILLEWGFFITFLTVIITTRDAWILFEHHPSNLLLSIPVLTVLLPPFFDFPLSVPLKLVIPHLTYLAIFALSIITDLISSLKRI